MYKVFLVDDEIAIREGIRNGFPWERTNFSLCGEAPDGELALPMIQDLKPDILLTDIMMPFMDGLALTRQVTRDLPWTRVIILSGYEDFSYAKEAISLGVKEYLLKPVSAKQLEEVLFRVAEDIREERERQADMEALRSQLASSARYAQEEVIARLLEGGATQALWQEAERLSLRLDAPAYLVILLEEIDAGQKLALQGIIHRLAGQSIHVTAVGGQAALLTLGASAEEAEERAYAFAQALAHEAEQANCALPMAAISQPVTCIAELPRALESARTALRALRGQTRRVVGSTDLDIALPSEMMEGNISPFREKLRHASLLEGEKLVEEYFQSFGDTAVQSLIVMHYMLVDVLLAATHIIRQYGGDPAHVLPERLMHQGELLQIAQKAEEALDAGKSIIRRALTFRDENAFTKYSEIVRRACAYIEANCHRPEITLRDVAGHVALSNNHFCTIFSQEMGFTFTEYLTDIRIARAKDLLLHSSLRTAEIANTVGYNDPHYFSYLFKKNVGVSPRDFKKAPQ